MSSSSSSSTPAEKPYTVPLTTLGKSGLKVSRICLGAMSFGPADESLGKMWGWTQNKATVLPLVKRAWEAGINFFDTADMYSQGQSEKILGECIREIGIARESVVIATKVGFGSGPNLFGRSRKHIFDACEKSLKNLGTNYIDLYIIHTWSNDKTTPIEETMKALNDLVVSGKVRYIGSSNMYAWELVQANLIAEQNGWAKFISLQNYHSLVFREDEREVVPAAKCLGVGLTPWSPLAGGFLTGSRKKGTATETARGQTLETMLQQIHPSDTHGDWAIIDRLIEFSAKKGVPPAQVALAWLLTKSQVDSPIIGATKLAHLEDAIAATKVKLSEDDIKHLEELYKPHGAPPFRG